MKKIGQNINSKKNLKKIDSTAILVLQNGKFFKGVGLGYKGTATGEVCFNTSITGYQEIISDPSYADQIINFDPASQRLEINTQSFGVQSDALFATINSKRVKRSAKTDNDFIYNQRTGRLYFNQNGSDKRWGDGGMFAVLIGKPELTSEIVDLI